MANGLEPLIRSHKYVGLNYFGHLDGVVEFFETFRRNFMKKNVSKFIWAIYTLGKTCASGKIIITICRFVGINDWTYYVYLPQVSLN